MENKLKFIERFCRDMNKTAVPQKIIGSLSNDDGKRAIGFDWESNNSTRTLRFFVHFFAATALLRRENA